MDISVNEAPNPVEQNSEVAELPTIKPAEPAPASWTRLERVAFRISFLYFFYFIFFCGNGTIFSLIPVVGDWIDNALTWPFNHLTEWTGQHIFHLTGLAATWHPTGSGDTTLNWILNGLFIVFSLVGGVVWTLAAVLRGNRRTQYQMMYNWLRFGLRLTCGFFMVNYGMAKLFPMQMAPISIAILNEPVGNMSPMTFLWALIGMNPLYQMICGFAEVLGGLLMLYRRTALAGALLSAFVITNVVLYNFFFDVPVKIFAVNLLMGCLFVTIPDIGAMISFFLLHKPAAPTGVWIPPATRKWSRITMRVVEWGFCLLFIIGMPFAIGSGWFQRKAAERVQTPLLGAWKLDPGQKASGSFITGEQLPATDLYIDTPARAFTRASDGALWRTYLNLDVKAHTIQINCFPTPGVKYSYQLRDSDHLVLTSTPPEQPKQDPKSKTPPKPAPAFTPTVLTLTRTPLPSHYPLLDRGFHYVNQWGLER